MEIVTNFLYQLLFTVGIVVAVGLLLALSQRAFCALMGRKGYKILLVTGIVGTPVHELSHAIMCILFGHKIQAMRLYQPNDEEGTLGYVHHSYNERSLYQKIGNFFIGIAPILGGSGVLFLLMHLLVPEVFEELQVLLEGFASGFVDFAVKDYFSLFGEVLKTLFDGGNLSNGLWWVFILLALMISSHMVLSGADIKNGLRGFLVLAVLLLIVDAALYFFAPEFLFSMTAAMISFSAYIIGFLVLAGVFSLLLLLIAVVVKIIGK